MDDSGNKPSKSGDKFKTIAPPPPQGMQLIQLLTKFFKNMGVLMSVWIAGYFQFSTAWVMIGLFMYLANGEMKKKKDSKRDFAREAAVNEREAILCRVEELPSWVHFPDVEKAEWLNKMIKQMWPFVGTYTEDMLRTTVEPQVQSSLPKSLTPFKFENIDLGDIPPRIGGVKVYTDNVKRDEIIMDLEIFYMGDSEIDMTVRGIHAGIKQFMIHGTLRVQMRPLIRKMPLIGGMHFFFLNPPTIDFDFTNTANILDLPVLSNTLRTVVEDQIAYYMVLPQKLHISMAEGISLASLKYPTPQGVLQLHIVAGKDLIGKDKHLLGKKTSDPILKLFVGAASFKTKIVMESLNPVWNQYFEAVVEEKHGQVVNIEVFDYDQTGDDDELGTTTLDIQTVANQGSIDAWLPLEGVKSGMIHVRALWLHLSKNPDDLIKSLAQNSNIQSQTGSEEHLASALLVVTVDSAKDLPRPRKVMQEPSPVVNVTVANKTLQSAIKNNTVNPLFEHNFEFLIHNPRLQDLTLEIVDSKKNGKSLGNLTYPLKNLMTAKNMTVNAPFNLSDSSPDARVQLRLCLRILTSELPADWALDTGDVEEVEELEPQVVPLNEGTSVDNMSAATSASGIDTEPPTAETSRGESISVSADQPTPVNQSTPIKAQPVENVRSADVMVKQQTTTVSSGTAGTELRHRGAAQSATADLGLGKLRATIRYSAQRNKLVLVVHNCVNLLPIEGDSDNSADPYLKIYILPERSSSSKRKTDVIKNNLNPVFDETFEWSMTLSEAQSKTIEIIIKNDVGVFSKSRSLIGHVNIDLSQSDLTKAFTDWFPLENGDEK